MKKTLTIIGLAAATLAGAQAQVVLNAWDTTGFSGTTAGPIAASSSAANVVVGSLSRGAGLTAGSLTDGFSSSAWSDSLANAISGNDYYQATVAASSGYQLNFTSINLAFRNTNTGVRSLEFQYSLDGFATPGFTVGSTFTLPGATTVANYGPVDLTGVAALQSVTSTVTFRLFGWNDTGNLSGSGTGAIGTSTGNDLVFNGTVTAIPEPSTWALIGLGSMVMIWNFRRRRAFKA